ncbi:MAG: hypothetical protein HN472_04170 [Nitrospina sp.]|jgi:hypothetical protein|nr:hypothetical protein [Nitrospina sp.]MBT3875020.1 hypothetical protein [Nitrospina sp.]MBT4049671.1 hypothetical protein [Nitrospina sp.]MBT4556332.1 hypothetical protein [Nitrospina sp.]MBT5348185.1 hypothetical protein [Nitrospina sp.]
MPENKLESLNLPKEGDCKQWASGSFSSMALGILFLVLVLALPSGITAWFDGLPWTGGVETIVLLAIVPFLLILNRRFLSLRFPIICLGALLVLKTVLFFGCPSSGWLIKVYPNVTSFAFEAFKPTPKTEARQRGQSHNGKFFLFPLVEGDSWVNTYATTWNKKASGILKNSWAEKLDFPLDWALMVIGGCSTSGAECFHELNPFIEVNGALIIPEGKKFSLIAAGVKEGTFIATNEKGESVVIVPAKNREEATQSQYQFLHSGRWRVSGKLSYEGKEWSLMPTLVDANGEVSSDLGRKVLWQSEKDLSNEHIGRYETLSFMVDGGILIFLFAWVVSAVLSLVSRQLLNWPLVLCSIALVFIPVLLAPVYAGLLNLVHSPDVTTISYLGFSIIAVCIGFLTWTLWKKDFRSFKTDRLVLSVLLLFGPAMLFFFANKWWSILGQWKVWGAGNDWTAYQLFARRIIVEREWFDAGEGVFLMQPLYRYIIGVYHLLFGQSAFAQHMSDVWCVLGGTLIVVSFAVKFRLSPLISFALGCIYLVINLISAFRYHIGISLTENHAMIFMMLAAWFLYKAKEGGWNRILLATLFGVLGYWTRQDHLGAIAGLAFLVLEPIEGPTGGWKGYWDRFKLRSSRMMLYWGGGVLSVLAICFRNWWLGGAFYPADVQHPNFVDDLDRGFYYWILTGSYWPNVPSISGLLVISGVFIAVLALVWRFKAILNFPFSLGVIFLGLLSPYAILWTGGYTPRFSIHILPLALLSWAIFLNYLHGVKPFLPQVR